MEPAWSDTGKCARLYRMSEYSGFILANINTFGLCISVGLPKFHCSIIKETSLTCYSCKIILTYRTTMNGIVVILITVKWTWLYISRTEWGISQHTNCCGIKKENSWWSRLGKRKKKSYRYNRLFNVFGFCFVSFATVHNL